ncbi:MAG: HDOD domain-containing protein [Azonexus sp.]|jgi:EAL and modified HD-GYP domain-containing signal transduction protein|uniref:EAL and HDOD domain-containing protein n=1 Tax=Azonexus sp. TaxID=1872668 RepID=UPI00281991FA|nr:HDOD domain-containing protein [Azonexus sp.]MDR0777628.1 HDOD domain-containing protein [Azonexus sp.]
MPSSAFLFIHPLLGVDDAWSGYRAELSTAPAGDAILQHLVESPLTDGFDHRHPWLLPATTTPYLPGRLKRRAVAVFPANPSTADVAALAGQEAALRQNACEVAQLTATNAPLPATGAWHYLLLTASHARSLPPFQLHGLSARSTLVATDVHSHADRQWFLDNACSLSTGEYLLARSTAVPNRADTTRLKLLELLALIAEDADTAALDNVFRQESKLSYGLLRLVNSAAMAPSRPITSFTQAINLLGRRRLQRWLQLLVYADPNDGHLPNPLLQKAAARGHLLETLALQLHSAPAVENLGDAAFMVGSFSLLNVLLNMSMQEIMRQLPLAKEIVSALTENSGPLGNLLRAIHTAEMRDLEAAEAKLQRLGIAPEPHLDAQLAALSWAAKIRSAH